ncbi:MAG: tetratricopeptide repeat protein [Alphaproteobacteria bacterium]
MPGRGAAVFAAIVLAGCAGDPLTDSVTADRGASTTSAHAGKIDAVLRVAARTAEAGDWATTASLYRRAHTLDTTRLAPLLGLGEALSRLNAQDEAADSYRAALALAPDDVAALRGLGNALVALDEPILAIPHLERALDRTEDARLYKSLGVAYDMTGDHNAAQAYYRTGLQSAPGDLGLLNNLGLSLALSGGHSEAIAILERTAAAPTAGMRQRQNLALAYGLAGHMEDAARVARRDLDEEAVRNNLAYYETLRALNANGAARSIGTNSGAAFDTGAPPPHPGK